MEHETAGKEKASPKHVFLHLFVIIMLYYSTVNLLILFFQYINYLIPDRLAQADYYQLTYSSDLIRFAIASLIIVFPVFIFTSRYLDKCYVASPAIREMRIRKWLIYFTLFVAALVIVGDSVSTILIFLQGEMTSRFIWKALSIFFTTGLIFYYYLRDLKQAAKTVLKKKYFVALVIAVVTITVAAGFFIIGSPKTERLRRFDSERVIRLQQIQEQIINYWRSKEYLPAKLTDLDDKISGFAVPTDPENSAVFEYVIKGPATFELCATFDLISEENTVNSAAAVAIPASVSGQESWKHGVGRTCFERTIDKQLYPPYPVKTKQ